MKLEGGCYCRAIRYEAEGEPRISALCYCRECQYLSGGGPNFYMLMPADGFRCTSGAPTAYARTDLDRPVTREFCSACGTQILSRLAGLPFVVLKVGTLDDPSAFGSAQMAFYTNDKQPFHSVPEGVQAFERLPSG